MRILSTILVFHVLFLTITPTLPVMFGFKEHCKKSCCVVKQKKQNQSNKGCCNNGSCNPFMVCCNSYALIVDIQTFFSPLNYSNKKFDATITICNSAFLSDAWHPPKIS
jgi:hypothetical protein